MLDVRVSVNVAWEDGRHGGAQCGGAEASGHL